MQTKLISKTNTYTDLDPGTTVNRIFPEDLDHESLYDSDIACSRMDSPV